MMNQQDKKSATAPAKAYSLPSLNYEQEDLAPGISAQTMNFHYLKHHQAYVDNLNKLVVGTPWASGPSLEKVVLESAHKADHAAVFNNAAQAWNHAFFWRSMKPGGGGQPGGPLMDLMEKSFGGFEKFKETFLATALAQFGSGWVWLVQDGDDLKVTKTANADTPMVHGQTALLTCDVWEHAYYLDYQNRRKDFVQAFLDHLADWKFAVSQLSSR